ncbi:hypothetical protein DSO57_1003783 [Entomophthora muscae]|uniref:Uncharacterized protein n=1 Tax=Entomophthora muscae TaxID=34485 RepID=A0ACC2TJA9_9FUNG|nr:hypothetical protein DSO57_1003783 [Entomophthora muscae]
MGHSCSSSLVESDPPCKLMLINQRSLRVAQYDLVYQHSHQKSVTQGFFATWARYSLDNVEGIGAQDPGVGLLRYIPYNLILSQVITGRWGPAIGTSLLPLPNANPVPAGLGVVPPTLETKLLVLSQRPGVYVQDTLVLLQEIYLRIFWLGLIISLTPSISFRNFTNRLSCSEARHRYPAGNPNLRIRFVLSLSQMAGKAMGLPCGPE